MIEMYLKSVTVTIVSFVVWLTFINTIWRINARYYTLQCCVFSSGSFMRLRHYLVRFKKCFTRLHGFTDLFSFALEIRCQPMMVSNADPPNGICVAPDGSSAAYNTVYKTKCRFTCRRGYTLRGSQERVCQLDKTWSGVDATCESRTFTAWPYSRF